MVIGVVETHGRAETEALVAGLERLPLKEVSYRDRSAEGVRPRRARWRASPQLILVDELAHSNVPGSRHPKRWQDVEELLDAGIDVWSTMNVQHLESLNDVVSGITGIRVWETVPDRVFDEADEVVIVDLPPDDLLQRLKEGKVYLPQQAATRGAQLLPQGQPDRPARAGAAPHRRPGRRRDAALPAQRSRWRRCGRRARRCCCASARTSARRSWCAPPRAWRRSSTCPGIASTSRRRSCSACPTRRGSACCACSSWRRMPAPTPPRWRRSSLAAAIVKYAHEHNLSRVVLGRDTGRLPPPWRDTLAEAVGAARHRPRRAPDRAAGARAAAPPLVGAAVEPSDGGRAAQGWTPYVWSAAICARRRRCSRRRCTPCSTSPTSSWCSCWRSCSSRCASAADPRCWRRSSGGRVRLLLRAAALHLQRERRAVPADLRRDAGRRAGHRPDDRRPEASRRAWPPCARSACARSTRCRATCRAR